MITDPIEKAIISLSWFANLCTHPDKLEIIKRITEIESVINLAKANTKNEVMLLEKEVKKVDLDALIEECIKHAKRDWKDGAWGYNEAEIVVDTVHLLIKTGRLRYDD